MFYNFIYKFLVDVSFIINKIFLDLICYCARRMLSARDVGCQAFAIVLIFFIVCHRV